MSGTERDPQRVRDQPALWTGTRRRWLLPTGLMAVVAIAMLLLTLSLQFAVPVLGIGLIVALYLIMVVCAIVMRDARQRNLAFAWLMSGIAVVAVVALGVVLLAEIG